MYNEARPKDAVGEDHGESDLLSMGRNQGVPPWRDRIMSLRIILLSIALILAVGPSRASGEAPPEARRLTNEETAGHHVRWAPDGTSILFASWQGGRAGLWRMAWPSGTLEPFETGLIGDHHISWSPDGSRIAFDAQSEAGPPTIWIISADGGSPREVTGAGRPSFQPSWSPHGSRIAFASLRSGSSGIWIVALESGVATQLTSSESTDHHPAWSPDGREILFSSNRNGELDIWGVSSNGGEPVCVWDGSGRDDHPCFSPDGRWIVFSSQHESDSVLRIVGRESGEMMILARGERLAWPSWSPDGTMIAYAAGGEERGIWVREVPKDLLDPTGTLTR